MYVYAVYYTTKKKPKPHCHCVKKTCLIEQFYWSFLLRTTIFLKKVNLILSASSNNKVAKGTLD